MYGNPDMSGFHMGGPQAFEGATEPSKRTIPMSDLPKINLALIKKRLAERYVLPDICLFYKIVNVMCVMSF